MRKMKWVGAAMVMGLMMAMSGCGKGSAASQPGGDTPKAVLMQAGDAVEQNDQAALANCFVPKDEAHPADPQKMAELMLAMKRTKSVMEAAHDKFGDQANQSLGMTGFILAMMSNMPDMKTLAEKGEIHTEGNDATAELTSQDGENSKMSHKVTLEKVNDRWFLSMKKMDGDAATQMAQMNDALKQLLDAMESATQSTDDASKYAEQIKPALEKFNQTMQAKTE